MASGAFACTQLMWTQSLSQSEKEKCGRQKVSDITSPIIQQKCLCEVRSGYLGNSPLTPSCSCNSPPHHSHLLGQEPPETGLPPKQLLLVSTSGLLKGNVVIQLPQERNHLSPVQFFSHGRPSFFWDARIGTSSVSPLLLLDKSKGHIITMLLIKLYLTSVPF